MRQSPFVSAHILREGCATPMTIPPTALIVEREARIVTLTFNGPESGNRLTPDVLTNLARVVDDLAEDQEAQVVIITGTGTEFFSSGILSPTIRTEMTKEEIVSVVLRANRLYDKIETLPQIVIVAFNGEARAGAAELSVACDIRLVAEHASFRLPEASWGGFPGAGSPVRLPMIVGKSRALEIMCTGRQVLAPEMERIGLALAVYPADRLMAEARSLAEAMCANGPLATGGAKRIVNASLNAGFDAARRLSDSLRAAVEYSQDVDEGTRAHAEGRSPRFTGR
jgi:enoyl-CoA hydratase/carnithine racemase